MKINKRHIKGFPQVKNNVKYIFIHNAYSSASASDCVAYAQKAYANGVANYYVDDKAIYETIAPNITAWHCGVYSYNQQSIGIEICKDKGTSDKVYLQSEANALKLASELCKKHKLNPDKAIMLHRDVYNTACPFRSKKYYGSYDKARANFKKKVKAYMKQGNNPSKPAGAQPLGECVFVFDDMRECRINAYGSDEIIAKMGNDSHYKYYVEFNSTGGRNVWDKKTGKKVNVWKGKRRALCYLDKNARTRMKKSKDYKEYK